VRSIATTLLLFLAITVKGQQTYGLDPINIGDEIPEGKAVIYGKFIPKPGRKGWGDWQELRIVNMDTKKVYAFRVKESTQSYKGSRFIYAIRPGRYTLLGFDRSESDWFWITVVKEGLARKADRRDSSNQEGAKSVTWQPYTFTVTEGSLNYIGTWHCEQEPYSIANEQAELDELMIRKYRSINFSKAIVNLPH
jgi:hypothetical protein